MNPLFLGTETLDLGEDYDDIGPEVGGRMTMFTDSGGEFDVCVTSVDEERCRVRFMRLAGEC